MVLASKIKNALTVWLYAMIVTLSLGETRAEDFFAASHHESGQIAAANQGSISDFYDASEYDASGCTVAPKKAGKNRSTRPDPDPAANGPHTIIEKPGPKGQYTTHNGDGTFKQYRGSGKDHGNVPRPNVKENSVNVNPKTGEAFPGKTTVRPPRPDEIPK